MTARFAKKHLKPGGFPPIFPCFPLKPGSDPGLGLPTDAPGGRVDGVTPGHPHTLLPRLPDPRDQHRNRQTWGGSRGLRVSWRTWRMDADGDGLMRKFRDTLLRDRVTDIWRLTRRGEILFLSLWWQKECIAACVGNWHLKKNMEL